MNNVHGLKVSRPISVWNRPLKADFKKLFLGLTKTISQAAVMNWGAAVKEAVESVSIIGLEKDGGQIAWLLIYRSIVQAMYNLVEENLELIKSSPRSLWYLRDNPLLSEDDLRQVIQTLDLSLEGKELVIDEEFFKRPTELALLSAIKQPFFQWLNNVGLDKHQSRAISERLPTYFIYALNDQWRTYRQDYEVLKEALDTPFTRASEKEQAWSRYSAWLKKQVEEPMFYEAFSLRQVYIPLRAYYERRASDQNRTGSFERGVDEYEDVERVVVDLYDDLNEWVNKADLQDAIRVISGGPGCGKSSLTKMFAASQTENRERRVLFIPLHRFDPADDLVEAVNRFVRYDGFLPHNPIDPKDGESRLLVIFDGLDELSMQGMVAAEIAQKFVQEVQRKVGWFNSREPRLKVLISGRELAVQSNASEFRKPQQVLHVLPYYVPALDAKSYIDHDEILMKKDEYSISRRQDQRQLWWATYGRISGKGYNQMPTVLEGDELEEITSQPLLNYLVALSYARGKINFAENTNLNSVYADLLDAVYQRAWAENQHPALRDLSKEDFVRILEEIAIAAWHGERRTTSVREIEAHCINSGLNVLLNKFKEGIKEGVGRLLLAFYFRKFGNRNTGDETFEFTHKSFGEYLAAKRIVRGVRRIHEEMARHEEFYDAGWDEREALTNWIRLCGVTSVNQYLFRFILNEMYLHKSGTVQKWQDSLTKLITFVLKHGIPFEKLELRPTYKDEVRQTRNAEESLLAVLSAASERTKKLSTIKWESDSEFREWVQMLRGHKSGNDVAFALSCLNRLELSDCELEMGNFCEAKIDHTVLRRVQATDAFFSSADLRGADLQDGTLVGAKFDRANLTGANAARSNLQNANFQHANLRAANLRGVNLEFAYLKRATLFKCNLQEANLRGANLDNVNLHSANLRGANLEGANLHKAILENADLMGAKVKDTDFTGAKFQDARWIDGRIIKSGTIGNFVFKD